VQQALRDRCRHPGGAFLEFPHAAVEQSIPDRFRQVARAHSRRLALRTRTHRLDYDALDRASNRVAQALLGRDGAAGGPVALLFEPGAPFVIASLGVLKAGRIAVPLDSTVPRARLDYMLRQSAAALLLTDTGNLPLARALATVPTLDTDALGEGVATADPAVAVAPDAAAVIGYTSGSTGQPKGIVWSHRGLLHAVMRHTNVTRLGVHDRLATARASVRAYLYALLNGAAYYPLDPRRGEPAGVADWLGREEVTIYRGAVSAFRSFARGLTGRETFPTLRLIAVFGEPVYRADVDLYRRWFSDRCLFATSLGCSEYDDYAWYLLDRDTPMTGDVLPGGYLLEDTEVLLLDEAGRPVTGDSVGEIAIRSPYNAIGYWRRPDLTGAAFLPDPAGGDRRLYRTGDVGRIGPDGCLYHLGRTDFQVKIRGYRVEVAEVEGALLDMAGVTEAVVVDREVGPGDRRLVGYLVAPGPGAPGASELRRRLAEKLPGYMVPATFVRLERLPLTATGKPDRRALPAPDRGRPALAGAFVPPRTPVEAALARIWSEVLGLDAIGIHDHFLDLGGNSLLATSVAARLRDALHVEVPLGELFEASTVAELAVLVDRHLGQPEEPDPSPR
jgi:amino acid adenylation domain-containing protein